MKLRYTRVVAVALSLILFYGLVRLLLFASLTQAQQSSDIIEEVTRLTISGNRARMAAAIMSFDPGTQETEYFVDVYNTTSFQRIRRVPAEDWLGAQLLELNSDGTLLAYSTAWGSVIVVDLTTRLSTERIAGGFTQIGELAWRPNSDDLAYVQGSGIWIVDALTPNPLLTLIDADVSGRITSIAWSPDGLRLASTAYSETDDLATLQIWDATQQDFSNTPVYRMPEAGGGELAWSPDGRLLAGTLRDGIHLYNSATGEEVQLFPKPQQAGNPASFVDWSPDGMQIVGAGSQIWVWDIATGAIVQTINTAKNANNAFWTERAILHNGGPEGLYVNDVPLSELSSSLSEP